MKATRHAIAAIAAASLAALTACSSEDDGDGTSNGGGPDDSLSGEVTMWMYPVIADEAQHRQYWDDLIAAFNEEHPDVDVNVEIYPWANRDEAITTAIASNTAPDAIYLIPDQLPGYRGAIEPIEPYLDDSYVADILPNVAASISGEDGLLGVPLLTSSNTLICDQQAFDAIGVSEYPSTWDDLLALAPQFAEEDIYVTNYWGSAEVTLNMTFYPLLWQAGGDVFAEDGSDVAFNSPEGVEALEFLVELAQNGWIERDLIATSPSIEQTAIAQNRVACTWQSAPMDVTDFWGGEENVIVLDPLTDAETVSYGTVGTLSMFSSSDAPEATAAWLEFAASPDAVVDYVTQSNYFSPLESTGALYADDPIYGPIEETVQYVTVGPLHESSREVMGALAPEIQSALLGDKSAQQALDDAAAAARSLLG